MRKDYDTSSRLFSIVAGVTSCFLIAPVLLIFIYSFGSAQYFDIQKYQFSLRWYAGFISNERFIHALLVSVGLGLIVTPIGLAAATPAALALVRGTFVGRKLINDLILSPLVIPGVVSGIAFLVFLSLIGIGPGAVGLVIALCCFTLPFAVRSLVANLSGLQLSIEDSARDLGASEWTVFWKIIFPQLRPGLLAGGVFIFAMVVDNFSITTFLSTDRTETISVAMYDYARIFDDPTVAAVAAVLVVLTSASIGIVSAKIGVNRVLGIDEKHGNT